jgi:hypothetical protein
MAKITLQNICVGTTFCQPELVSPHNQMMRVTGIKYNKNAGKPCYDMWGGKVWEEPFATIEAVGELTGEQKGYTVQSEDSDLSSWLTFCTPEQRINSIYASRKDNTIRVIKRNLPEMIQAVTELPKFAKQLNDDEDMKKVIEMLGRLAVITF